MLRRVAIGALATTVLVACATDFSEVAPRGGWRAEAERACMDRRAAGKSTVADAQSAADPATPAIVELPAIIEEPCGIDYPLKVSALGNGQTVVSPVATLGCPLTEALEAWLQETVQPAALKWVGSPVVEISQISNYACRKRNNFGKGYSEHAFGNALDISGYKFANGRETTYAGHAKNGPEDIRGFYDEIFASACQRFTTLLGPGFNLLHYNHIHVDLALVAPDKSPKMCKPTPKAMPLARAPADGAVAAAAPDAPAAAADSGGTGGAGVQ
jgi:hypothetical protein